MDSKDSSKFREDFPDFVREAQAMACDNDHGVGYITQMLIITALYLLTTELTVSLIDVGLLDEY